MSALGPWEKLHALEGRHQRVEREHDAARRGLRRHAPGDTAELHAAWRRYCEVIAELERSAAEFEELGTCRD